MGSGLAIATWMQHTPELVADYGALGLWGVVILAVLPWAKRAAERVVSAHLRLVDRQAEEVEKIGKAHEQQTETLRALRAGLEGYLKASEELGHKIDRNTTALEGVLERLETRNRRAS